MRHRKRSAPQLIFRPPLICLIAEATVIGGFIALSLYLIRQVTADNPSPLLMAVGISILFVRVLRRHRGVVVLQGRFFLLRPGFWGGEVTRLPLLHAHVRVQQGLLWQLLDWGTVEVEVGNETLRVPLIERASYLNWALSDRALLIAHDIDPDLPNLLVEGNADGSDESGERDWPWRGRLYPE